MTNFLENKKILLIVSGGIASYKSLDLIRRLQEKKVKIDCILTLGKFGFLSRWIMDVSDFKADALISINLESGISNTSTNSSSNPE